MVYDTDVHIPGQVDFFLMCYDNKNFGGVGASLETLLELVKDDGFKKDIKGYEAKYNSQVKVIEAEAVKKLRDVKGLDDAIQVINESQGDADVLFAEYLKTNRNYVVGYFKKVE